MHILVTNDDGVDDLGLLALKQALDDIADVSVLAPARNWSSSGHSKTMHKILRVDEVTLADGSPALATSGAPSDCVVLALLGLVDQPVDMVVSGINQGGNLGYDVTYSGTVAAALEAAISGVPAIAVSLDSYTARDFDYAARFAARLAIRVAEEGLPPRTFLNLNIPAVPEEEIAGVLITREGLRIYHNRLIQRVDPKGRAYYWIGGDYPTGVVEEGTDLWALAHNYVSITPLQLDLTHHDAIPQLEAWNVEK